MSQTKIEVKELTFNDVKVSQEMYQLIMKGKSAVSTTADIIAEICEQGMKDNIGVVAITKIVKGIFGDSLSERHIRRLTPKNCKNENMIRDPRKDKVKLFVDIQSVKSQEHEQRIYLNNLRYPTEQEIADMATREMSANSNVTVPKSELELDEAVNMVIERENSPIRHIPPEIKEQWDAEKEAQKELDKKHDARVDKNYQVISGLIGNEGYFNSSWWKIQSVLVDEIVRLRERIAELEGKVK
jgi:hypothetical protein